MTLATGLTQVAHDTNEAVHVFLPCRARALCDTPL